MYFVQKDIYEIDGERFVLRLYLEKKSADFIHGRERADLLIERESPAVGQGHQDHIGQWRLERKKDLRVFLNMSPVRFKESLSPSIRGDHPFLCKDAFLGLESLLNQEGKEFASLHPREDYLKKWPRASFDGVESLADSIKALETEKARRRHEYCPPRNSATDFFSYSLEDLKTMMENKGSGMVAIREVHLHKDVDLMEVVMDITVRHAVYLRPKKNNELYHVKIGGDGSYYGLDDDTYDPFDNGDIKVSSEFNLNKTGEKGK